MKKIFALLIAVMLLAAFAGCTAQTAAPAESAAPVEESAAPVEESAAPVEESAAPAESAAPVEESAAPVEESAAPAEESAAPAVETAAPAETTKQDAAAPAATIDPDVFEGEWLDITSQRAMMDIDHEDEDGLYHIVIAWADSAAEDNQWRMTATYSAEKNALVSTDCAYYTLVTDENGKTTETMVYENGKADLTLKDGKIYWTDYQDKTGAECVFERIDD